MPINEVNGKREYDPAKRIRAAVGEEESANIDAEALEKLTQAAVSTAVRNDVADKEESAHKNNFNNDIVHSSVVSEHDRELNGEIMVASRKEALTTSKKAIEALCAKKDIKREIGTFITGFDKGQDKAVNISNAFNMAGRFATGFSCNYAIESNFHKNDMKKASISVLAGTTIDVVGSMLNGANNDIINSVFDPNFITQAESENINKSIRSEKIKYAVEHALAGVIAPAGVKMLLKKVMPKALEHNKILEAATSYGTLSTIGKSSLMVFRTVNDKKLSDKVSNSEILVSDGEPSELYTDIAKLATRKSIDNHMDQTIVSGIVGSVAGYNSINVGKVKSVAKKIIAKPTPTAIPTAKVVEKKEPASVKPAAKKLA